jgi:capsular polysaccharide biosynthesis protein
MQAERDSLDRHIATSRAEEARLQGVLASYRDRVEAAPAREAQLTGLMRDYDTLEQSYKGLLAKSQESDIAADLERRQIGEQFRVIDPARLPERPISPNRPRFNGMGAAGGLIIGLALIALLEYRDTSVRTDEDVTLSLALPVLAVIPLMITSGERKRNRRRTLAAATASLVLMMSVLAFAVWKMDLIPGLVR